MGIAERIEAKLDMILSILNQNHVKKNISGGIAGALEEKKK